MKTFKIFLEEYSGLPREYGTAKDPRLDITKPYKMAQDDPELMKLIRVGADNPSTEEDDGLSGIENFQADLEKIPDTRERQIAKVRARSHAGPPMIPVGRGEDLRWEEAERETGTVARKSQEQVARIISTDPAIARPGEVISPSSVAKDEQAAIDTIRQGIKDDPMIEELLTKLAQQREEQLAAKSRGKKIRRK